MGSLISPLTQMHIQNSRAVTSSNMEYSVESLYGFAIVNGRLPYADTTGDGIEDTATSGDLPWATLAIGKDGWDYWGEPLRYVVDAQYVQLFSFSSWLPTIEIKRSWNEDTGTDVTDMDRKLLVPAVVFTQGRELTPRSNGETENSDSDLVFVDEPYVPNRYDDMILSLNYSTLVWRMLKAQTIWYHPVDS